jgi:hypothetical protein
MHAVERGDERTADDWRHAEVASVVGKDGLRCCTQVMSSYNTYCFTEGRNGGADEPYFGMLSAGTRAQIESQAARDREAWKNRPPIQNGPVDTTE